MGSITPKQLAASKDDILILDIRDSSKFNEWHIDKSVNVDVYNSIWSGDFDTVKKKFRNLPKERKIITICNAGVTSQHASAILESIGYQTSFLEKGMMGWNELHLIHEIHNDGDLEILQVARVGKGCLSYIISSRQECYIVDPSQFIEEYMGIIKEKNLKVLGVIETHVHADHISGALQLSQLTNSNYYVSGKDLNTALGYENIDNLNELRLGDIKIKILRTPGHTNGSVCLLVNNFIFTGDTLFIEGVGRPDLSKDKQSDEKAKELFHSIAAIKSLDKDTIILPAHSFSQDLPVSTKIKELFGTNKIFKIDDEKQFVTSVLENIPQYPPNYEQIKGLNKNLSRIPRQMASQLEFGPNRCASKSDN